MLRLTQDIDDILGMRVHDAGGLANSRKSFEQAVKRAPFRKGPATRRRSSNSPIKQQFCSFHTLPEEDNVGPMNTVIVGHEVPVNNRLGNIPLTHFISRFPNWSMTLGSNSLKPRLNLPQFNLISFLTCRLSTNQFLTL